MDKYTPAKARARSQSDDLEPVSFLNVAIVLPSGDTVRLPVGIPLDPERTGISKKQSAVVTKLLKLQDSDLSKLTLKLSLWHPETEAAAEDIALF